MLSIVWLSQDEFVAYNYEVCVHGSLSYVGDRLLEMGLPEDAVRELFLSLLHSESEHLSGTNVIPIQFPKCRTPIRQAH